VRKNGLSKSTSVPAGSLRLSRTDKERFASLLASGAKRCHAQRECKISRSTARRWEADSAVQSRIDFLRRQSNERAEKHEQNRPLTFGRNDVLMELWDIATSRDDPHIGGRARVGALTVLADHLMLRPKRIEDLLKGIGWNDDEFQYTAETGLLPERIRNATGRTSLEDLIPGTSVSPKRTGSH
jgi:hypothetical protein